MIRHMPMLDTQQAQGLARTKSAVAPDNELQAAAKQFEALLTNMMLKSMREATPSEASFPGQSGMFRDMYDKELSTQMTQTGGLGLADLMVAQLKARTIGGEANDGGTPLGISSVSKFMPFNRNAMQSIQPALPPIPPLPDLAAKSVPNEAFATTKSSALPAFDASDPKAFVASIWPQAQRAAKELNVPAEILVAQAALETGWGKKVISKNDGSSHNLFGIKSSRNWSGQSTAANTQEYVNGHMQKERANFRAYDSVQSSFDDYVGLLKNNPRYQNALSSDGNAAHFAHALQNAGYATDPDYAKKLIAIAQGPTMRAAVSNINTQAMRG